MVNVDAKDVALYLVFHSPFVALVAAMWLRRESRRLALWSALALVVSHALALGAYFLMRDDDPCFAHLFMLYAAAPIVAAWAFVGIPAARAGAGRLTLRVTLAILAGYVAAALIFAGTVAVAFMMEPPDFR